MSHVIRDGVRWECYYPAANGSGRLQVLVHGNKVEAYTDPPNSDYLDPKRLPGRKYTGQTDETRGPLWEFQATNYRDGTCVYSVEAARVWVAPGGAYMGCMTCVGNMLLLELSSGRNVYITGNKIVEFSAPGRVLDFFSENVSNDVPYGAATTTEGAILLPCDDNEDAFLSGFEGAAQAAYEACWDGELTDGLEELCDVEDIWHSDD